MQLGAGWVLRNPDHAADLERLGAGPVLCDLETDDVRPHLGAAEAIVFAAGATRPCARL